MDAWPIEEVWLRPIATACVAAGLGPLVVRAVRSFFDTDAARGSALALPRALSLGLAYALGATALGPALASARDTVAGHALGLACAGLFLAADAYAAARAGLSRGAPPRDLALLLGGAAALDAATWAATGEAQVAVVAGALALGGLWSFGRAPDRRDRPGWIVGATLGGAIACAAALPVLVTPIAIAEAPTTSGSSAYWRLRVDPWDATAMLAAAWAASAREEPRRARAQLEEARRMGLTEAPALELEAELAATRGDCDGARALFDRALRARALEAFDEDALAEPLLLGGYHLPPTMVTECGALEELETTF